MTHSDRTRPVELVQQGELEGELLRVYARKHGIADPRQIAEVEVGLDLNVGCSGK